jgi:hypothetical protein
MNVMNDQLSNLVRTFPFKFSVWSKGADLRELCFTLQKAFTCHKSVFFFSVCDLRDVLNLISVP